MYVRMHVCMYVCTYGCVRMCVCMYVCNVCIYVYIYVCMYVCMNVGMYVYIYRKRERERKRDRVHMSAYILVKNGSLFPVCRWIFEILRRNLQFKMFMHLFHYFLRKPGTTFCGPTLSSLHCTTSALISQLPTCRKCSDTRIPTTLRQCKTKQ